MLEDSPWSSDGMRILLVEMLVDVRLARAVEYNGITCGRSAVEQADRDSG
jgi:hypothetical protein